MWHPLTECSGPSSTPQTLEGTLLGGSWVAISGVISRVTILTTHIRGLITLLITTREPPSILIDSKVWFQNSRFLPDSWSQEGAALDSTKDRDSSCTSD